MKLVLLTFKHHNIMPFPIIPVLALLGIVGGISALAWYSNQSKEDQEKADKIALQWFGRKFKQLTEHQQEQIRKRIG